MRILLDTNRYVDLAGNDAQVLRNVEQASEVFLPFVVIGELRAGFQVGTRTSQNERKLVRFLNDPNVSVLFADEDTTHHYAVLYRQLRVSGVMIPTNDLWIAALAVQHNLLLYSRDAHFNSLPQIERI